LPDGVAREPGRTARCRCRAPSRDERRQDRVPQHGRTRIAHAAERDPWLWLHAGPGWLEPRAPEAGRDAHLREGAPAQPADYGHELGRPLRRTWRLDGTRADRPGRTHGTHGQRSSAPLWRPGDRIWLRYHRRYRQRQRLLAAPG